MSRKSMNNPFGRRSAIRNPEARRELLAGPLSFWSAGFYRFGERGVFCIGEPGCVSTRILFEKVRVLTRRVQQNQQRSRSGPVGPSTGQPNCESGSLRFEFQIATQARVEIEFQLICILEWQRRLPISA